MRLLLLSGLLGLVAGTAFQDCGSKGKDVFFSVEGCEVPPCLLMRGKSYQIDFKFTASGATDTLTVAASANIGGLEVPWPGLDPDACKGVEATANPCPIEDGSHVEWNMEAFVLSEYPKLTTMVTFKLLDQDGNLQTCAKLPAQIV
ncbi:NPC intracellular cholesterol transporter 2 homolog a-like [Palaemon carinicauda]|uniref:NPC intracellular cholesterol transporter 2 homolog a-like n=1 Tax=Palaemon carinicauda TaxID=392227 RepID=UPI0035B685A1